MRTPRKQILAMNSRRHIGAWVLSMSCMLCSARAARAETFARASSDVTHALVGGAGTTIDWSADPAGRYLNAQAYVDHPDVGPAGSFIQSSESFTPLGTGFVSAGPVAEGALASVDFVSAEWLADGGRVRIGQPGAPEPDGVFASLTPPSTGFAFGESRAELANLFRLAPIDPDNPSETGAFTFSLAGSLSLAGQDLPTAGFAESLLNVRIYDAESVGSPLFSWSRFDQIAGPGSGALDAALNFTSDPITLDYGHYYLFEFIDDAEVQVPEPTTATLAFLLAAAVASRRRSVPRARAARLHSPRVRHHGGLPASYVSCVTKRHCNSKIL